MFFPTHEFGSDGFYGNIRPRSKYQYDVQRAFGSWFEPYGNWMEGRSKDAYAAEGLQKFNLDWSDIKYPWVASLSGGNTASAIGSGLSQVSTNIMDLYSNSREVDRPRRGQSDKAFRKEMAWKRRRF